MSCAYLLLLRTLRAVLRTALLTVLDALGIKDTAQHVITHAGKVAHTSATDQHNTVFLKVMAFAGNIADDFALIGQADLGNLAPSRVRIFRGCGLNPITYPSFYRVFLHLWNFYQSFFSVTPLH